MNFRFRAFTCVLECFSLRIACLASFVYGTDELMSTLYVSEEGVALFLLGCHLTSCRPLWGPPD